MQNKESSICLFREIRLYPTRFYLDVFICDNLNFISSIFNKRYGLSKEYYQDNLAPNQVCNISPIKNLDKFGTQRIVMNITSFDDLIITHEISHVLFHLAEITGLETSNYSQEWCSYFIEYIKENFDKDKFIKYRS